MKRTLTLGKVGLLLTVVAFLALAGVALAATEASWNVMAGGGGHAEAGRDGGERGPVRGRWGHYGGEADV